MDGNERSPVTIRGIKIPSKKNRYLIKESKTSERWRAEGGRVSVAKPKRWIGPSKEVKDCENAIAWHARSHWKKPMEGPVRLDIAVAGSGLKDISISLSPAEGPVGRKYGDLDGVLATVSDALQKWPLSDDSQIVEVRIVRKEKL